MYASEVIKSILTNDLELETQFDPDYVLYAYKVMWQPTEVTELSDLPEDDLYNFCNEINNIWEVIEEDPDTYTARKRPTEYDKVVVNLMSKYHLACAELEQG